MLNADVALLLDIDPDSSGMSQCQFGSCPPSPTASLVSYYADNARAWIKARVSF